MNRRDFIISAVAASASFGSARGLSSISNRVNVTDFGADPRGITDSTASVRTAIAQLGTSGGALVFPYGRYALSPSSSAEPLMVFNKCNDIEINGDGSTLLFSGFAKPFAFTNCRNLHIHDLSVDYPRPPFSQGKVLAVGERWFDIKIDPEFPIVGGELVEAFADYDPRTSLMVQDGVDSYYNVTGTTLVGPQTLRVALKDIVPVREGSTMVLRHQVYGSDVFAIFGGSGFRFEHIKLLTAPGMGILAYRCRNITVNELRVDTPANSTRLMSLTADATHFAECSGAVTLTNCRFRAMGDDAINSHSTYWEVTRRADSRSVEVLQAGLEMGHRKSRPFASSQLPFKKDRILLLDGGDFHEIGELSIEKAVLTEPCAQLTFTEPVPAEVTKGTLVCDLDNSPATSVRNCQFLGNRARAILAHRNTEIIGNTIRDCSLAGILLTSDPDWMEGPPVKDVRIENNHFSNCYYSWPASRRGVITLDIYEDKKLQVAPKARIHHDVHIVNNMFGDTGGAAVYCTAASKLNITNNQLARTWIGNQVTGDPDAIVLMNCADSEVSGNTSLTPQKLRVQSCAPTIRVSGNTGLRTEGL